jgi:hypothetical protein
MRLSVVSIATNGYTKYWLKMVNSFIENLNTIGEVEFHILTDDPQFVERNFPQHKKIRLLIHQISAEPWPMPTLLRYSYMDSIIENVSLETIMYIDADMIIHPRFDEQFEEILQSEEINFVAHPGYWRGVNKKSPGFNQGKVDSIFKDILRTVRLGALGDWETRKESLAYVSRKLRKEYVCGGVWFGPNEKIGTMVKALALNTQSDLDKGVIAKWHDESYLNYWYAHNGGNVLTPEYCYDPTYFNLKNLIPRIEAVDKGNIKRI